MTSAENPARSANPYRTGLSFTLNEERVELEGVEYGQTLAELLRDTLDHTGTKVSCEVQVCGACTVLVDGAPVSSCCTLAVEVAGRAVTTVEGLASDGELHPVQRAFVENFAIQCGYCTPGMVLSAVAFLDEEGPEAVPETRSARVREFMNGNYCRCTGYESILRAIVSAAEARADGGS